MTRDELLKAYAAGRRDFAGAVLGDANLTGANLRAAVLYGADLRRADLARADLYVADLRRADLRGAALNWESHEFLAEVLRQAAGKCPQRRALAGLVLTSLDWCWDDFLRLDVPQKMWALKTLRKLSTPANPMPGAKH